MLPADRPFAGTADGTPRLRGVHQLDHKLLACVISLLALGLVMVFSASSGSALARNQDKFQVLRSQAMWAILGLATMGALARLDYGLLRPLSKPLLVLSFVLLGLVFSPLGRTIGGGTRWIVIAGFSFQPSEVMRLALVLYLADLLSGRRDECGSFTAFVMPALFVTGAACTLILKQPNLSYTIIVSSVSFLMVALGYKHWHHMAAVAMAGLAGAGMAIASAPYRWRRFTAFLDPWADPYGSGWNIIQSLYALSSGGLWGLGVGRGRQKFEYLPQESSDYIFAILGEELGFLGALVVLGLFGLILWRGLRAAVRAPDAFGMYLAFGITMSLTVQAVVNVSVVVGCIPPTGVPLPFISSGGTSLVASLAAVGVLLSVSRAGGDAPSRRRPRGARRRKAKA